MGSGCHQGRHVHCLGVVHDHALHEADVSFGRFSTGSAGVGRGERSAAFSGGAGLNNRSGLAPGRTAEEQQRGESAPKAGSHEQLYNDRGFAASGEAG